MSEFITLEKGHESFSAHLLGTFSKEKRALPVKSFHANTDVERITFRLVDKEKIQKPSTVEVVAQLFRVELLGLTLMPLAVTLILLWNSSVEVNWFLAGLALLVATFFHGAAFSYNDYIDHIKGIDRVGVHSGSRVIQEAWLTAHQVHRISLGLMAFGGVLSLPIIYLKPLPAIGVAVGVMLGVLGYSFAGRGFRARGLGPTLISLCLGPLLTCGVSMAAANVVPMSVVYLGFYFGFLAALYLQLRHFERIMADDELKIKTLISRLGFDKSKKFILLQLSLVNFFFGALIYFNGWSSIYYWGLVPLALASANLFSRISRCQSPLSSSLEGLRSSGAYLHLVASFTLFLLLLSR